MLLILRGLCSRALARFSRSARSWNATPVRGLSLVGKVSSSRIIQSLGFIPLGDQHRTASWPTTMFHLARASRRLSETSLAYARRAHSVEPLPCSASWDPTRRSSLHMLGAKNLWVSSSSTSVMSGSFLMSSVRLVVPSVVARFDFAVEKIQGLIAIGVATRCHSTVRSRSHSEYYYASDGHLVCGRTYGRPFGTYGRKDIWRTYGRPFGKGDIIAVEVFGNSVLFFHNGKSQGVAYDDIPTGLIHVVALHAGSSLRLLSSNPSVLKIPASR